MVIDEIVRLIEWYVGRVPDVGHSTRASPSLLWTVNINSQCPLDCFWFILDWDLANSQPDQSLTPAPPEA